MGEILTAAIVHGTCAEPGIDCTTRNWFPWLKQELETRSVSTTVPQFPTPVGQSISTWLETFSRDFGELTSETVLFGHSLGAGFLLNLLNRSRVKVRATFLVSGFVGEIGSSVYDPLNRTFFHATFDWNRIRDNAGELFIYAGDDDPYVPFAKSLELMSLLSSELTVVPRGGHLNQGAGFTTFPKLLKDFDHFVRPTNAPIL